MLKHVPGCISPDLLRALSSIGHGSKILIADGNCDINNLGHSNCFRIRADGHSGAELLEAILKLIPLDDYIDDPIRCCLTDPGVPAPDCWKDYEKVVAASEEADKCPNGIVYQEGDVFWSLWNQFDLVIASGETDLYGNIFLQKGVFRPVK